MFQFKNNSSGKHNIYNKNRFEKYLYTCVLDELDSYMYQTVGHQNIELYAEAMGLPLYREAITGNALNQSKNYNPTDDDEVEDLYRLLVKVKVNHIL